MAREGSECGVRHNSDYYPSFGRVWPHAESQPLGRKLIFQVLVVEVTHRVQCAREPVETKS